LQAWGKRLTKSQADAVWSAMFSPVTGEDAPCRCYTGFPPRHTRNEQPICDGIVSCLTRFHPDVVSRRTTEYLRDGFGIHLGHPFYDMLRRYDLLLNGDNCFQMFLGVLTGNPDWGRKFIEGIGDLSLHDRTWFCNRICSRTAEDIGILYGWLQEHYPAKNNSPQTDEIDDDLPPFVYDLKDQLSTVLVYSGKEGSARIVEEQIKRHGDREGHIATARRNEAAACVQFLSPEAIQKLVERENARLIVSVQDLQECVLSLLEAYQRYLKGKTPAVSDLWNTGGDVSPKEEEAVSDHLVRFLRDKLPDAMSVNREVQISRKLAEDGEAGTRTDIWIDCETVCQKNVSLCIEVKCSWNKKAKTAISEQLVGRYMSDGRADAGILLLAWYHCDAWKDDTKGSAWTSLSKAGDDLTGQASEKSNEIKKPVNAFVLNCTL